MISDHKALLNKTKFISSLLNDNNLIWTMDKILKTLMIQHIRDWNWFNRPMINLRAYTRSIIKFLFFNNFCQYLTEIENKIKQLLVESINKFEYFFEKANKIKIAATISRLSRLIYNNLSLDLIWTQFYRNGWLENMENFYQ